MANKNRNKGNYHEKWFVDWLKKLGFQATEIIDKQRRSKIKKYEINLDAKRD